MLDMDSDYTGFALVLADLIKEYLKEREQKAGTASFQNAGAKLLCNMTTFVAENHGGKTNANLVPSKYLS